MKIYTEIVYYWDDAKGELVKESEKSFDYKGPMTLCEPMSIAAVVIASVQLASSLYGQWTGQEAAETAREEAIRKQAQRKALAIKQYEQASN